MKRAARRWCTASWQKMMTSLVRRPHQRGNVDAAVEGDPPDEACDDDDLPAADAPEPARPEEDGREPLPAIQKARRRPASRR